MEKMIPIPVIDSFPSTLRKSEDIQALASFLDTEFARWRDDAVNLETLKDPARAPAVALNAFGEWLSAGIKDRDDDRTKRAKITNATDNLRFRSTWPFSAKPLIDSHAGGDAQIIAGVTDNLFILIGLGNEPTDKYWSSLGIGDPSEPYGIRLAGGVGSVTYDVFVPALYQMALIALSNPTPTYAFALAGLEDTPTFGARLMGDGSEYDSVTSSYLEPFIKGIILIDIDNSMLLESDVEALKNDLQDIVPCYFRIYLGYLDGDAFIPYSNGQMG